MKYPWFVFFIIFAIGTETARTQAPDLSKFPRDEDKIKAWMDYCESLRLNQHGTRGNYVELQQAALKGLQLTKAENAEERSRFFFYAAFGYYYQVKFDSAQYYFYQSLGQAEKAKSAKLISAACVALIPINFQLRQQDKVDSCKDILQSILDTTHNASILPDIYYGIGSYYQEKSYYSTAQDYFLKGIELRKKVVDTTHDAKLKADYAIQCYLLSKQYENTDLLDKSLAILKEGQQFTGISPAVDIRYLSSFTEIYSLLGNIDSALHYEELLEERTRNSPTVPSEMVTANMNIAQYYMNHQQVNKALPFADKADTLAVRSKSPLLLFQAQMTEGRYLEEKGKFEPAIALLSQSLPVAKQISKEQYTDILKYLAIAEKGLGNTSAALQYYQQYVEQLDSLTKEKISRNFADQETRYQTNQKEQRIASLDKENRLGVLELQNASRTRLLLVIGLAALGVIALLLYFIYRNKEKVNKVLNKQNDRLEELNGRLEVANETKAKLFGIIGHDLRSPVSKIVQLLQLQKENPELLSEEARRRHEGQLKNASENVLETMEDILLWSKSQMQHFTPEFNKVKIADVIRKELDLLRQQTEDKNIIINQRIPDHAFQNTDENFLAVIVRNLLQNAAKYSDPGSAIDISADDKNIYISNQSSQGNTEILNAKLKNRQVDSKGSGLGLQIAADLATSIRAKIFFEREDSAHLKAVLSWEK